MQNNSSSKFGLYMLLGIIAVGFVTGLYFIFFGEKLNKNSSLPGIMPTMAPTGTEYLNNPNPASPSSDKTINWKTYSSKIFKVSFLYPSNLSINGDDLENNGYLITDNNNQINISIRQDNSSTITEYLSKTDIPSVQVVEMKKTIINGLDCIQRTEYLTNSDINRINTYFKKDSTIVSIILSPVPGNSLTQDKPLYDQILSTFKFLE